MAGFGSFPSDELNKRGLTIQNKVAMGFIGTLVVLSIVGFSLLSNLNGMISASEWWKHSYEVMGRLDHLYRMLQDAHRNQRGYIITGDNMTHLVPYKAAKQEISDDLNQLFALTHDNPKQQANLRLLEPLIRDELSTFDEGIQLRNDQGFDAARKLVLSGKGMRLMSSISEQLGKLQRDEKLLLEQRLKTSQEQAKSGYVLAIIGSSIVLLILLILYTLINREIHGRERTENRLLEARNEAQAASKMKSEFLANMSHEIRTPMNGILGMAEILSNTELEQEQRRYLQMIDASGRSLLTIINDILDFSKIEAGRLTLEPIKFKLRETIGEALYPFSKQAAERHLELLFHIKSDIPNYVMGDPHRIRQIINNLVGNAVKFTQQGEIYVGMELMENVNPDDKTLKLHGWVSDTGIGLSAEKISYIFEPFTQGDGSTTRRFGGTGLGLSITRQLVRLMNGTMWVESEEDKGSTFHFSVELGVVDRPEQPIIPVDIQALKDLSVLVVDDNATSREIFKEFLKEWQMVPMLVDNAQMALELLRHAAKVGNPYQLALLDVGMPGMDGFSLVEQMKNDPVLSSTKIVILTSYGQPGDVAKCQSLHIDGYLTKPVGQQSLLYCIRSIFSPSFYRPEEQDPVAMIPKPVMTEHSIREHRFQLHILLAEDNEINQTVAVHMLHEAGHWVDVAVNGKVALDMLSKNKYDLVLMDIHMPEMDGFETTAHIRNQEMGTDKHMPIIALTANAIKGDRELCLDAGMDGYLSKPFRKQELVETLSQVLSNLGYHQDNGLLTQATAPEGRNTAVNGVKNPNGMTAEEMAQLIDKDALMNRIGDDLSLLSQLIAMFRQGIQGQLTEIETAIRSQDAKALEEYAHTLKGSISNFTDKSPYEAAKNLEMMGKGQDLSTASDAFNTLKVEVDTLQSALEKFEATMTA